MPKRIDTSTNDQDVKIRFHMSSARMSMNKLSFVAFQRFLDEMERSMFLCPECGWRGRGKDLIAMEQDQNDVFLIEHDAETWYSCPRCECEIAADHPIMKGLD
ncbi:MAG: hypothetical protein ABL925_06565 [Methylococcales bacterium]